MGRPAVCRLACSRNNACEILGVCSLNNIEQAYRVIGKHIYTACLRCGGDKIIVIIANTTSEAEEKAQEYFGLSCVSVSRVYGTNDAQVYEV